MENMAPIVLFTYRRIDTLKQTIEALQRNYLAKDSDLIIYSDGSKDANSKDAVETVREYLKTIEGFKSVLLHFSDRNKGLAKSIINGVTEVLLKYESAIVLEDDLISSPNFLNYMNEALRFYKNIPEVFTIAGFSIPIKHNNECDIYFTSRANSTGWATWVNKWNKIDWLVSDYDVFRKDKNKRKKFNKMGSDLSQMLDRQMAGKLDSWAIRWCYHQFKNNLFSVHPFVSKIDNVGFNSSDATNTKEKFNRFKTILDNGHNIVFNFSTNLKLDNKIIKQFVKPFSIISRIKYKLRSIIS